LALKRRDVASIPPCIKRIHHVPHSPHGPHCTHQPPELRLKHWATQPHAPARGVHADGVRVRDDTSKLRPHSLNEHAIVYWSMAQNAAGASSHASGTMCEIAPHRTQCVGAGMRGVHDPVANQGATPTAALGIHEIHEPDADADSNTHQHCSTVLEHRDASTMRNAHCTQPKCH
jgi:hypothetical protein